MKHLILFLFLLFCGNASYGQDWQQLKEEIDKVIYFDTKISHDAIPGFVIGIVVEDSTYIYGYGQKEKNGAVAPDENTLFEIGSVTKIFTASLVGILSDEGLIHHDSSLNSYLPASFRNSRFDQATIGKLLTHTSGLPKIPNSIGKYEKEINNPYAHYSKKTLLEFYKEYEPSPNEIKPKRQQKKGVNYLYSHLNYALLEIVIEQVTQKDFESVLQENLFAEAKMQQSFIHFKNQEQVDELAAGYARSGLQVDPWEFASFSASQGMKSNTTDLLYFLKAHLQDSTNNLNISLSNNAKPIIETGLTENASMGFGWHILHQKKYHDIKLHAGSTGGHRAFIGFIRETKTAVVVLSNSENSTGGLGYLLLRLINHNWKKK